MKTKQLRLPVSLDDIVFILWKNTKEGALAKIWLDCQADASLAEKFDCAVKGLEQKQKVFYDFLEPSITRLPLPLCLSIDEDDFVIGYGHRSLTADAMLRQLEGYGFHSALQAINTSLLRMSQRPSFPEKFKEYWVHPYL